MSEPAWGSVRFMVADHSPETMRVRYRSFCSSLPTRDRSSAAPWPRSGQRAKDMQAEFQNSCTAMASSQGMPCPPWAGSKGSPFQPPSTYCR